MRKPLLALFLAALLPVQAQAASSVAGSWPTNATVLTDAATIGTAQGMVCPGQAGASGFYTLTVLGNNHTISLPQCTIPADFKFAITQGAGGPYTGLVFSSAGALVWPGGTAYVQSPITGALDYVSGTISNLTGSNEWDVTGVALNLSVGFKFVNAASCASASGATCTTAATNMTGVNLMVYAVHYVTAATLTGPTDSSSNSYTSAVSTANTSSGTTLACYYDYNPTVTSSMTFSANFGGSSTAFPGISVAGFSGAVSSPLDQTTSANSGASTVTSQQPGSITPTQPNELVVPCLGMASGATSGISINGGYTLEGAVNYTANNEGVALGYLAQTAAVATNPTFSWTTAAYGLAGIMSFK